jgi:hypothetical protein
MGRLGSFDLLSLCALTASADARERRTENSAWLVLDPFYRPAIALSPHHLFPLFIYFRLLPDVLYPLPYFRSDHLLHNRCTTLLVPLYEQRVFQIKG